MNWVNLFSISNLDGLLRKQLFWFYDRIQDRAVLAREERPKNERISMVRRHSDMIHIGGC
jgi:hypothetical protein